MIEKDKVKALVEQWLEGKEYFLTDLTVTPDDCITVEIDHADGVWIDDCVQLSRFIEEHLSRDEEDWGSRSRCSASGRTIWAKRWRCSPPMGAS